MKKSTLHLIISNKNNIDVHSDFMNKSTQVIFYS